SVAAVVALLAIFAKPITQGVRALFADMPAAEAAKPSDRLTATSDVSRPSDRLTTNIPQARPAPSGPMVATATTEVAPPQQQQAPQPAQQAALTPPQEPRTTFRGVTDSEIRFGISAPFTGPAKELGQNIRLGIETAFRAANANGGVFGRQLRLVAADDGYDPTRTGAAMKQLF